MGAKIRTIVVYYQDVQDTRHSISKCNRIFSHS